MPVLGIDPGTVKAGFALVRTDGSVIEAGIVSAADLLETVRAIAGKVGITAVALGRGTNAPAVRSAITALGVAVHLVDEYETTRRARELYFTEHPPSGWRRLFPVGLQLPPRPVDDYAAILIARRFLAQGELPDTANK